MAAPALKYTASGLKLSAQGDKDHISVSFESDKEYVAFECRATKAGEPYGVGRGTLLASFSQTPANTLRQFDIYNDFLVDGDGDYRISLFAQAADGSWNDNHGFITADNQPFIDADGKEFLCMR